MISPSLFVVGRSEPPTRTDPSRWTATADTDLSCGSPDVQWVRPSPPNVESSEPSTRYRAAATVWSPRINATATLPSGRTSAAAGAGSAVPYAAQSRLLPFSPYDSSSAPSTFVDATALTGKHTAGTASVSVAVAAKVQR